jgi:virulence factor Mce-like protein
MRPTNTPEELQKAYRAIAAIVIVVLVGGGLTLAVRASYGAFSDDMVVHLTLRRAGQALHAGSDVKYRGVNVGKVRSVHLVDRKVEVALQLHRSVKVPNDTVASVRAKTLFGEKYVQLAVRRNDEPPYLKDGDHVRSGGTGTEVDELIDGTDHLFRSVDANELATLMTELSKAARGEGRKVATLIDKSVPAAAAFSDTIDAQVRAVQSLERFTREYRDIAPSFNGTSRNLNQLLPTFNAAQDDFRRLLDTLRPFSDHLADFVEVTETDVDKILTEGGNIARVVSARKAEISQSIEGLARYTYVLSHAVSPETLPDGSHFGYLKLFIDVGDLQDLICKAFGPTGPGSQLAPVLTALAAVAPQLACTSSGQPAAPVKKSATPAPGRSPEAGRSGTPDPSAALNDEVMGALSRPDQSVGSGSVNSLLSPLLGGGA